MEYLYSFEGRKIKNMSPAFILLENISVAYWCSLVLFLSPDNLKNLPCIASCWCTSQYWSVKEVFSIFCFIFFWVVLNFVVIKLDIHLRNKLWFFWLWPKENDTCVLWEWILVRTFVPPPRLFFFFCFPPTSQAVTLKETVGAVPQVIHKMSLCLLFHPPSGYKAKLESCLF